MAATTENFWKWDNISNVLMQQTPFLLIISMGMTMAIITKGLDLSMGQLLEGLHVAREKSTLYIRYANY